MFIDRVIQTAHEIRIKSFISPEDYHAKMTSMKVAVSAINSITMFSQMEQFGFLFYPNQTFDVALVNVAKLV